LAGGGGGAYNNNNTHTHKTYKIHKTLPKTHFQKTTTNQPTNQQQKKIGIIIGINRNNPLLQF
jgi:hypothetical protein